MVVTEVRVKKYEKNNVKGFATITLDNQLVVSGLTILDGKNGLFVSMPQNKSTDGKYHDNVFPLSKELRQEITNSVIDAFNKTE